MKLILSIPEQGIHLKLTKDKAIEFLKAEIVFFRELAGTLQQPITHHGVQLRNAGLSRNYQERILGHITSLEKDSDANWHEYVESAKSLQMIVGQGEIGEYIKKLIVKGRIQEAKWITLIFSGAFTDERDNEALAPFRSLLVVNFALSALGDCKTIVESKKSVIAAKEASEIVAEKFEEFTKQKSTVIDDLENLYREQLTLQNSAKFWAETAKNKGHQWQFALIVFASMIIIPLFVFYFNANAVTDWVLKITSTSSNGFSVSGLAVVSLPAILYGWLLKNVSRIFIQNMLIADDASHRRALAITYIGLAKNQKLAVTDQDRVLILNALFRPTPSNSTDEGPPTGLLEFVRGRPGA